MSPEERSLLARFLQDLGQARGGLKDAEAAQLIDQAVRRNPDAAYLLVQHAILSDQALHAAQAQVADLQAQLQGRGSGPGQGGFLGGGPWGRAAPPPQPQPYAADPSYPQQGAPARGPGLFGVGPAQPGGFGSFLRGAGTTAAGVAGGAFLVDALSGLFGGHRGGWGGGFGGAPVENVTINEYGDQPDDGQPYDDGGASPDGGSFDDGSGYGGDDGGYDDGGVS